MRSKVIWYLLVGSLAGLVVAAPVWHPAAAQDTPQGWTLYELNLRAGPGVNYSSLAVLAPDTGLIFEARSGDLSWLLGRTADGALRGWVSSLYLRYEAGFAAVSLPVSSEIIGAAADDPADTAPEIAPGGSADAWTSYALNLRSGPGTGYAVIQTLSSGAGLILEARNADTSWLLGHTEDESQRGWMSALYLRYRPGFAAASLPISEESIGAAPVSEDAPPAAGGSAAFLMSIPVVPAITSHARTIYLGSGNNPHVFSKIGDCNSSEWAFMSPFDTGQYDLGSYGDLQAAVDFFRGSFSRVGRAAHIRFKALTVIDATWADPAACLEGESPVWCELRTSRAAVAIIMFGANDVYNLSAEQFDQSLRQIVEWSIRHGTIPVLTTFSWCGGAADKALQLNTITVNLAREYDVPLINFWRAARDLPNCGMADDIHLSTAGPPYGAYFTGQENEAGFTLRNLVTLQTLDALRQNALN